MTTATHAPSGIDYRSEPTLAELLAHQGSLARDFPGRWRTSRKGLPETLRAMHSTQAQLDSIIREHYGAAGILIEKVKGAVSGLFGRKYDMPALDTVVGDHIETMTYARDELADLVADSNEAEIQLRDYQSDLANQFRQESKGKGRLETLMRTNQLEQQAQTRIIATHTPAEDEYHGAYARLIELDNNYADMRAQLLSETSSFVYHHGALESLPGIIGTLREAKMLAQNAQLTFEQGIDYASGLLPYFRVASELAEDRTEMLVQAGYLSKAVQDGIGLASSSLDTFGRFAASGTSLRDLPANVGRSTSHLTSRFQSAHSPAYLTVAGAAERIIGRKGM